MNAGLVIAGEATTWDLSPRLRRAVESLGDLPIRHGMQVRVSDATRQEAARYLPEARRQCAPVTRAWLDRWLMSINAVVSNPRSEAAFDVTAGAMMICLGDMPAAIFNVGTLREAQQRFKFFPSGAELTELLSPHARPLRRILRGLENIVHAVEPPARIAAPEAPPPKTAEDIAAEKEAVRRVVASFTAEMGVEPSKRRN